MPHRYTKRSPRMVTTALSEELTFSVSLTRLSAGSAGELGKLVHHRIGVDSDHMGHVEEGHFLIQHLITYYFMEAHPDDTAR